MAISKQIEEKKKKRTENLYSTICVCRICSRYLVNINVNIYLPLTIYTYICDTILVPHILHVRPHYVDTYKCTSTSNNIGNFNKTFPI